MRQCSLPFIFLRELLDKLLPLGWNVYKLIFGQLDRENQGASDSEGPGNVKGTEFGIHVGLQLAEAVVDNP